MVNLLFYSNNILFIEVFIIFLFKVNQNIIMIIQNIIL